MSVNQVAAVGVIDRLNEFGLSGWAYDRLTRENFANLRLIIDETQEIRSPKVVKRPDVARSESLSDDELGFEFEIPLQYLDGKTHNFQIFSGDKGPLVLHYGKFGLIAKFEALLKSKAVISNIEKTSGDAVRGWLFSTDFSGKQTLSEQEVLVQHDGRFVAKIKANLFRPDVAARYGCPPNCGFSYVPPIRLTQGGASTFRFFSAETQSELTGSPAQVKHYDVGTYDKLFDLHSQVERLFVDIWKLRTSIGDLLPKGPYNLYNYDAWAKERQSSLSKLLSNAIKETPDVLKSLEDIKVSILCPIYRPRLKDLREAVLSALNQTHKNIEVILVDDRSDDELIERFCSEISLKDNRILYHVNEKNMGISESTNAALIKASGDYIVLFDHDDLMVPEAVQIMLLSARRSGAKIIYSDEDKIDDQGHFSEPNLKPDFNYRLLLCQNYICHLLMVERNHLFSAGLLDKRFDGAQDHDLLLRLVEISDPEDIFHVPEVLYHWRKTPQSTASSISNKSYASTAGASAVLEHLNRIGQTASVKAVGNSTFYKIDWVLQTRPKVAIIIPFRDQIETTKKCLDSIFDNVQYDNFEVILIDNMSTTAESTEFKRTISTNDKVRVIDYNDEFNYSAINNFAVSCCDAELLLFMNNDVMVTKEDWLSKLVGELLSDQSNGAVGCKLVYPQGFIQHAGVILGIGGVADHAFKGLLPSDGGYVARAICAQELSAVTAACMLCRRSVFDAVSGFDDQHLAVAFNDVDLCLKIRAAGYKVIWTPDVVLEHHESLSRGSDFKPARQAKFFDENAYMWTKWAQELNRDPFYNCQFSKRNGIFYELGDPNQPFDW